MHRHHANLTVHCDWVQVLSGGALQALLGSNSDRTPDIFIMPNAGVVYTTSLAKVSDHGG